MTAPERTFAADADANVKAMGADEDFIALSRMWLGAAIRHTYAVPTQPHGWCGTSAMVCVIPEERV